MPTQLSDTQMTVLQSLQGAQSKCAGTSCSITERKASETGYQSLLDAAPEAIVVVDSNAGILPLNRQAEEQFGYSRDELVGQKVTNIIPQGFADCLTMDALRFEKDARARQISTGIELHGRRKDGSEFPGDIVLGALQSAEGILVMAVIRDITTRKDAEARLVREFEELKRWNKELGESVLLARAMTQRMTHLAAHDALTGLPNRLLLNDRVGQAIASAQRGMHQVAVMFLDVDDFKHINDSLGHGIGDKLLQSMATRLTGTLRAPDTMNRYAGDEFVVLLPQIRCPEDAAIAARRLQRAAAEVHSIEGHDLHVTISVGISIYPEDGIDAEALIESADSAMYQAKEQGKQSFVFRGDRKRSCRIRRRPSPTRRR